MKRCWSFCPVDDRLLSGGAGTISAFRGLPEDIAAPVAGATAAYSLDSNIADATATNGVVEIVGKGARFHHIVVVTSSRSADACRDGARSTFRVGLWALSHRSDRAAARPARTNFATTPIPARSQNSIELKRTQGKSFTRMQVINATCFPPEVPTRHRLPIYGVSDQPA